MGFRLADKGRVRPEVEDETAQGLPAVPVVAEENGPVWTQFVEMAKQPALGRAALAVLLAGLLGPLRLARSRVLLGLHELRHERPDAIVAVGDGGRREHRVEGLLEGALRAQHVEAEWEEYANGIGLDSVEQIAGLVAGDADTAPLDTLDSSSDLMPHSV